MFGQTPILRQRKASISANLNGANFQGIKSYWPRRPATITAEGAHMQNVQLQGAKIGGYSNFRGADLQGADMRGADISHEKFEGVNLRNANLLGANFTEVHLIGANLDGANLQGALLRGVNFTGVDLSKANLYGADMRGAYIWAAKPPTPEQLKLIEARDLQLEQRSDRNDLQTIWESVEDDELRLALQNRFTAIMRVGTNWDITEDYAAWNTLKTQGPDVRAITEFIAELICNDASPEGYIANTLTYNVSRYFERHFSSYKETNDPETIMSKNPEMLLAVISSSGCAGANSITAITHSKLQDAMTLFLDFKSRYQVWLQSQGQTNPQQN